MGALNIEDYGTEKWVDERQTPFALSQRSQLIRVPPTNNLNVLVVAGKIGKSSLIRDSEICECAPKILGTQIVVNCADAGVDLFMNMTLESQHATFVS